MARSVNCLGHVFKILLLGKNFGGHHFVNPLNRFLEDRGLLEGFLEGFLEVVLRSRVVTAWFFAVAHP